MTRVSRQPLVSYSSHQKLNIEGLFLKSNYEKRLCEWTDLVVDLGELGIEGDHAPLWDNYTKALQNTFVSPIEQDDYLLWSLNPSGGYVVRLV
jgi:hypothetical protein